MRPNETIGPGDEAFHPERLPRASFMGRISMRLVNMVFRDILCKVDDPVAANWAKRDQLRLSSALVAGSGHAATDWYRHVIKFQIT